MISLDHGADLSDSRKSAKTLKKQNRDGLKLATLRSGARLFFAWRLLIQRRADNLI